MSSQKIHLTIQEGIVLGYKVSKKGIEIDKAEINKVKVDLISNMLVPISVEQVRSFLSYDGFYLRFIKDFSRVVKLLTNCLAEDSNFGFDDYCMESFEKIRTLLVSTPIVQPSYFSFSFEII